MIKSLLRFPLFLLFCFTAIASSFAQQKEHPIADHIQLHSNTFKNLESKSLLEKLPEQNLQKSGIEDEIALGTLLSLNSSELKGLLKNPVDLLQINIPVNGKKPLNLKLYQTNVFSDGFQVYTASNPNSPFPYQKGLYYWGIVDDKDHSLAGIAIHEDEIMGFIHIDGAVYNLGKLNQTSDDTHVLFKEKDLQMSSPLGCGTNEDLLVGNDVDGFQTSAEKSANNCVKMYVEVDYDIYVGKGGVTQAADYVSDVFSQVAILYANESINFTVNEILVWDIADPYSGPSTSDYLSQFRSNLNGNFNGDLAHLVGYNGSGGIAYVDVLCNSTYGVGYSDINSTFANVPTYSWTIEVVTHEIGHNLGSRHTHDCVWNGDNTSIDGCGPAAGYGNNCGGGPIPTKGTIMSYCHLVGGVGIDFNLGFGQQPGDLIRNEVYNAPCLGTCVSQIPDDAGISSISSPVGSICTNTATPIVELFNYGTNNLTSVSIEYLVDANTPNSFNWTGTLAPNSSTSVNLPSVTFGNGSHTFSASTSNPNGNTDTNTANDESISSFDRPVEQTYYADTDGDGYGDPNITMVDCIQPAGFVSDNSDCNDNDANAYPGASCSDDDVCTTNDVLDNNCNCTGSYADTDGDGVCDGLDICPGGDDNIDSDGDNIPDYCDCNPATNNFMVNPVTHSGAGTNSTTVSFAAGSKDISFDVFDLNSKTNGNPNSRYIDEVTITYTDGNGGNQTYGTFLGTNVSSINVSISGEVQSVTVLLQDGYDGNYSGTISISMSAIDYCIGCPDADGDGICDADDVCQNLDDNLIGTACDDGDVCTENDVYGSDCNCAGTAIGDSDGDGVCDAQDVCNGGDDNVDSDGDGIPDDCDTFNCSDELVSSFSPDPLTHQGTGSSNTIVSFPAGNEDVNFTVNGLGSKTNGNPNKRYIEEVSISYVDGNGATVNYGTFSGSNQGSVSVSIPGGVQSVEVALTDIYDGDTGNETISVDISDVISCLTPGSLVLGGGQQTIGTIKEVEVYPNPTHSELYLRFDKLPEQAEIRLTNILGTPIGTYNIEGQSILRIDLDQYELRSQTILVYVYIKGQKPLTKRVMILK